MDMNDDGCCNSGATMPKATFEWTVNEIREIVKEREFEPHRAALPEGWIELAGGWTAEKVSYRDCDSWPDVYTTPAIGVDTTSAIYQDPCDHVTYDKITIEHVHFCPDCRKSAKMQRELGRRLMEQGYWEKDIRPKPVTWETLDGIILRNYLLDKP